jgi:hypothetical protein
MKETKIFKDLQDNGLVFRRTQDATHILEGNKESQIYGQDSLRWGKRFASVPEVILEKWIEEGIDYRLINKCEKTRKAFYAKLQDPEFRALRTHTGSL